MFCERNDYMNIGQNILNLRKGANLSQEQLAEIIGVTRQTLSNWELEESSPDLKQAKELSRFFNISLDDLTGDSTFEYLGGNNRENEITIISSVENVIVTCNKIQAFQEDKGHLRPSHQIRRSRLLRGRSRRIRKSYAAYIFQDQRALGLLLSARLRGQGGFGKVIEDYDLGIFRLLPRRQTSGRCGQGIDQKKVVARLYARQAHP